MSAMRVAEPLDRLHLVARQHERAPLAPQVQQHLAHEVGAHGVEAAQRLVEDQDLRLVQDGGHELHLLLHALGQLVELALAPLGQAQPLQPGPHAARGLRARHALEAREDTGAGPPPPSAGRARAPRACSPTRSRAAWSAGRPSRWTVPASGARMFITMRRVVVLPAPLGPSRPNTLPRGIASERSLTATWPSKALVTPGGRWRCRRREHVRRVCHVRIGGRALWPGYHPRRCGSASRRRSCSSCWPASSLPAVLMGWYLLQRNEELLAEKVRGDALQPPLPHQRAARRLDAAAAARGLALVGLVRRVRGGGGAHARGAATPARRGATSTPTSSPCSATTRTTSRCS